MSVGLMVGYNWWTVGEGSFFNSLFSTIYVQLENKDWGSKYPVIMNKLYFGDIPLEDIESGMSVPSLSHLVSLLSEEDVGKKEIIG